MLIILALFFSMCNHADDSVAALNFSRKDGERYVTIIDPASQDWEVGFYFLNKTVGAI